MIFNIIFAFSITCLLVNSEFILEEQCVFKNDTQCELCKLCKNNALCQLTGAEQQLTCYCKPGYSGIHCQYEINECLSEPCSINSTCIDLINSYKCECKYGLTGSNCDTQIENRNYFSLLKYLLTKFKHA